MENSIFAQENLYDLGEIIVSASRIEQPCREVIEDVLIIDNDKASKILAHDLGELLNKTWGIDTAGTRKFGQPSSISINGSSSRHVKLMVDGIPFNNQLSGQASPSKIPIGNIDRVEIIKGAGSTNWGSALGGVVNVITKDMKDTEPYASFTSTFAEFGTYKEVLDTYFLNDKFACYLYSEYMISNGADSLLNKNDAIQKKIFSKFNYSLGDNLDLYGLFGYSAGDVSYDTSSTRLRSQPYYSRYGKIGLKYDLLEDILFESALKYNYQDIDTNFFPFGSNTPDGRVQTKDKYRGLDIKFLKYINQNKLVIGFDYDTHVLKKTTYAVNKPSIEIYASYINYLIKLGQWNFKLGCRYDHNSEYGDQVNPQAGFVYHIAESNKNTSIRFNVARAFNAPPLLWKYYDLALSGLASNPDIKPERSWVYELGFKTELTNKIEAGLNLYRSEIKDAIVQARNGLNQRYMENFEEFTKQGAGIYCKADITDKFKAEFGFNFNDVKDEVTGENIQGNGVTRISYDLGFFYEIKDDFLFSLIGYYHRFNESDNESNDRRFVFDAKITKIFKNFKNKYDIEYFLAIYNLFDTDYWQYEDFKLPERYAEWGVKLKW